MILLTIFVFVFILGLLVFVHELGHFIMAKRGGMRVDEFGFGFPPRLFGFKRGETLYSINLIPLGGFVKVAGEDGGAIADPRSFGNKGFWSRLSVLLAGVIMNFILAWFLLFLGFAIIGAPTEVDQGADLGSAHVVSQSRITIIAVEPGTPAEHAGFRPGDAILAVNDQKFVDINEMIAYTKSLAGTTVVYQLKRGAQILSRDVIPRQNPPTGQGAVGFEPAQIALVTYPLFDSLKLSFADFASKTWAILSAFGMLLRSLFTSGKLIAGLSGPVGIAVLTRDFTNLGLPYLLQFTVALSINLGIINVFPFPALDGGRVLFLIIEKIRGVKSVRWEQIFNTIGFALLILLMVAVTFRDVSRFSEQLKSLFQRIL
jgi:regulator of sigma E protease